MEVGYGRYSWYTTVEFWLLSKLSYCKFATVKTSKKKKKIKNPPTHIKRQIDVSRGNFGMDGFR